MEAAREVGARRVLRPLESVRSSWEWGEWGEVAV